MIKDDIIKLLPKWSFIIWGSTAIATQNKLFNRTCNDYDIMISRDIYSIYKPFFESKWTIDTSKYWTEQIFIISFEDWSKIDCIINNNNIPFVEIDWNKYLTLDEVVRYKINLIKNNISLNINLDNKHTKDIIFLSDKRNNNKYTEYYKIEEVKAEEMPF